MSNRPHLRAPDRLNSRARTVLLRESATAVAEREDVDVTTGPSTATRITISEASTGGMTSSGGRRYKARLIEGDRWGTSGYWPKKVIERDGPKVWPAGTQMYLNHPTDTEEAERPERDVRDLAGTVVTTPAYEGDGLYATIEVFPHAQPLIESIGSAIGLSIRGGGTAETGTIAGRTGPIIESLTYGSSVDFVTRAGAGGKIMSLAEAARLNPAISEALGMPLSRFRRIHEAATADMFRALNDAVSDAYGDQAVNGCLWVRDYDPDQQVVWFDMRDTTDTDTWQQSYTVDADLSVTLTGARTEVIARTVYSPAPPDDPEDAAADAAIVAEADGGDAKKPYGDVKYADPGYQDDKKARYPIDSAAHVKAALSYLGQSDNAALYSAADLKKVKDRIAASAKDFGIGESAGRAATTTDVADGTPPTVSTQTVEEGTGMTGPQNTGTTPDAAGTSDAAVSTAVTEAQNGRRAAELALDESNRQRLVAETELARFRAVEAARPIVTALLAESQVTTPVAQSRVMAQVTASVPLTEANVLDETAFRAATATAITEMETVLAEARQAAGAGSVSGLGSGTSTEFGASEADKNAFETAMAESFKRLGHSDAAAKIAAGGRY
jgi:hypothetical protein